jgi:hypothetical protein
MISDGAQGQKLSIPRLVHLVEKASGELEERHGLSGRAAGDLDL